MTQCWRVKKLSRCLWAPASAELRRHLALNRPKARWPCGTSRSAGTAGIPFENEWQSVRIRQNRALELMIAPRTYERPRRYTVAVKAIDIFGNDTMTLVPVNVG